MYVTTGARFYTALDNCMQRSDQLETECLKDVESARMFRSGLSKTFHFLHNFLHSLQIVNKARDGGGQNRIEHGDHLGRDRGQVSVCSRETGDVNVPLFRYMLKLFRDYVFHQVMEDGRPFLDMSHVISCLNRLDAGIPDKVEHRFMDVSNVYVNGNTMFRFA